MITLYHETGAAMAASIINTRQMGSTAWPHPAEFLLHPDAAGFLKMGRFSGRGVILLFEWSGDIADIHENSLQYCDGNILYHVYMKAEFREPEWVGDPNEYWHSRIVPSTQTGLRLVGAMSRKAPIPGADYSAVADFPRVKDEEISKLNNLIGRGIDVAVPGLSPDLSRAYLTANRKALQPNFLTRALNWLRV
jgi:hypothetical protein